MRHPHTYAQRVVLSLQSLDFWPKIVRIWLIRAAGGRIARDVTFETGTTIVLGALRVGRSSFVNRECLLEASSGIEIGERTALGPRVTVLTLTHDIMPGYPRCGPTRREPVSIGSAVWIGAASTILPGTTIGDGCVIAAGSLVRGSLAADGLYAGVPARRIRDLPPP